MNQDVIDRLNQMAADRAEERAIIAFCEARGIALDYEV